ncbi:winged helix-turn-helix domain-containing protein [Halostagnicola kamekurae]|uniref:Winged helix-turn-helix DNA-binding n=1 Tax=Halostagnicola kamekurae TaxID=619731 RepID=A0A1I6V839_9EURY|nr:winged helix-turn-helix domain-containing protein [Halostagnicola kamekurae]SFT09839.1 Winged helix-turn-helix DNA-binding [Halostagnicola kamekurae]
MAIEIPEESTEILRVFESARDPVLTAREIGDELGIQTQEAHDRLKDMEANGMVKHKVGVWWSTPAPHLKDKAVVLIQPTDPEEPVSLSDIREKVCDQ